MICETLGHHLRVLDAGEKAKHDQFWTRISAAIRPAEAAVTWEKTFTPFDLPSPWAIWTLIGLVRHRQRQLWVGEVVSTRLDGDIQQLAKLGHLSIRPIAHARARSLDWLSGNTLSMV